MYDFKTEEGRRNFLNLLWRYVNISHDYEAVKSQIGLKTALCLKFFLADFLESRCDDVNEFLKTYEGVRI